VADALSRKPEGVVASLPTTKQNMLREVDALWIDVVLPTDQSQLTALQITLPLVERIKERQKENVELVKLFKRVDEGKVQEFSLKNALLWFQDH